jgi:hypothetical protein
VAAGDWVLKLGVELVLLIWIGGQPRRIRNIVQHVNSHEVGHLDVHHLPVKQLESQIQLIAAASRIDLHVVEVYLTFADSGLRWPIIYLSHVQLLPQNWRLIIPCKIRVIVSFFLLRSSGNLGPGLQDVCNFRV